MIRNEVGKATGLIVLLTTAFVLNAACTPRRTPPAPPTSTLPSLSTTADAGASAEKGALAAYRGMLDAYVAAGRTTNPQYTDLARYAEGDALNVLIAGLESNRKQGLITQGDVVPSPQVTELTPPGAPDTASIRDCLDTTRSRRVKASPNGSPFADAPGGKRLVTATAKKTGGSWKVTSFVPMAVGTC